MVSASPTSPGWLSVVVGVVDMTFRLIASHMFMMQAVDCICSYHGPQLGPIRVGMWYLLISICVIFVCVFLQAKGADISVY